MQAGAAPMVSAPGRTNNPVVPRPMGGPKARHPDRSTIVTPHADRPPVLLFLVLFAGLLSLSLIHI